MMKNLPTLRVGQYKHYASALLCTTLHACSALPAPPPTPSVQAKPEQARSADSFVDSIGVNTHLTYLNTAYKNYTGIIKPRLKELGIRHIRDGAYQDQTFFNKLKELSSLGIKSTLIFNGNPPAEIVATAKTLQGALVAVEGPNETDLEQFNYTYNGQKFPEGTRAYQNKLYKAIKSNRDTKNLPVLMPSMGWGKNAETLKHLDSGDIGNMHSYPNLGNPPTDGLDWWFIPYARKIVGDKKPLMATETGYHNLLSDALGISETAAAKYLPRLLLEHFNRGIQRAYLYEFINEHLDAKKLDTQQHYGLLRYDGSPKPAFIALKNLILLVKDPGTSFPLNSLDYSLSGNKTNVHHTLLQKRDGTFYLILWKEVPSFSPQTKKDLSVPAQQVTLTLNTVITKAAFYQPIKSITPTWQSTSRSGRIKVMRLSVLDHPLAIELVPARRRG